jgi:hypothetical protein
LRQKRRHTVPSLNKSVIELFLLLCADERDGPSEVPGAKDGRGGRGEEKEGGDGGRLSQVREIVKGLSHENGMG